MLVAAVLVATACSAAGDTGTVHRGTDVVASTEQYLPGVEADVYLPTSSGPRPIVVMVPGGAWRTADRSGLTPLARDLAAAGIVVVNATHRAADTEARFPAEVQDVVCSVDFAAARAAAAGGAAGPVIILGHSSGGHLAALAALAADHFRGACPYPHAAITGLIGLAGLYDISAVPDVAEPLFGVPAGDDPDLWREGNALTWTAMAPAVRVFLAHGDRDDLVPVRFTTAFGAALRAGGHQVDVHIVPGADHHDIYAADVIGPVVVPWIERLSAG